MDDQGVKPPASAIDDLIAKQDQEMGEVNTDDLEYPDVDTLDGDENKLPSDMPLGSNNRNGEEELIAPAATSVDEVVAMDDPYKRVKDSDIE